METLQDLSCLHVESINTGGSEEDLGTRLGLQCAIVCRLRVQLCIAFSSQIKSVESTISHSFKGACCKSFYFMLEYSVTLS